MTGIVAFQACEQRLLGGTRHEDAQQAVSPHLVQHLTCPRHLGSLTAARRHVLVEDDGLAAVQFLCLFFGGLAAPVALCEDADGADARAPLMLESIGLLHRQPILRHHLRPRIRMARHTVKQYAVHVKKEGPEHSSLKFKV